MKELYLVSKFLVLSLSRSSGLALFLSDLIKLDLLSLVLSLLYVPGRRTGNLFSSAGLLL